MTNKHDSSAPNSPNLTRLSGEQAEERTAREGRLPEIGRYFVEGETKWFRLSNGNLLDTGATDAEIAFYAECSRLASRVEELESLSLLVINTAKVRWSRNHGMPNPTPAFRTHVEFSLEHYDKMKALADKLLAGAHAEEKP